MKAKQEMINEIYDRIEDIDKSYVLLINERKELVNKLKKLIYRK